MKNIKDFEASAIAELTDEALDNASGGYLYSDGLTTDIIDDNTGEVIKTVNNWNEGDKIFKYCEELGVAPMGITWPDLRDLRARNAK